MILDELLGYLAGDLLAGLLGPVFRPIERLASRMLSRAMVIVLWGAVLASYLLFSPAMNASSPAVRVLGLVAFMALTPLAMMATLRWRERQRTARLGYPVRGQVWAPRQ